jgi:hypothetical protein
MMLFYLLLFSSLISLYVSRKKAIMKKANSQIDFNPSQFDNPATFFRSGLQYTRNILDLPVSNKVITEAWSGDYWAWRFGGISARYGKMDTRWRKYNVSISLYSQPEDYLNNKNRTDFAEYVNKFYSPAEKYDLLVGDYNFTLTRANKEYGKSLGRDVPSWPGMCHGLAPASYMVPTPSRDVNLTAADGKTVLLFLPDDIKALATQYWAQIKYPNRMIGQRIGYINPASFFILLTNYIGRYKLNASFAPYRDSEIWNFALSGYDAKYLNLITNKEGNYNKTRLTLNEAKFGGNFTTSLAKSAPKTTNYIVGVNLKVEYIDFITARHVNASPPRRVRSYDFSLALFLDKRNQIISGVWTSRKKPSYVWGPDPQKTYKGPYDDRVPTFKGTVEELNRISKIAIKSSEKLLPLKSIVYYLANKSYYKIINN